MSVTAVDQRVRAAALHWGLCVGVELAGGTRSTVYGATDRRGRDLVLKVPGEHDGSWDATAAEAAALTAWAATGAAATLVDATADALLLVRARPGGLLPWRPDGPVDDTIAIAGELLRRLWSAQAGPYRYPTVAEVVPDHERTAREDAAFEQRERGEPDRGAPGLRRLPAAAAAANHLLLTTTTPTLLHVDFISKNVVRDATSPVGWVAIDPLPVIGDPAAEVGAFAAYHPAERILPIDEALARWVELDPSRARRWAAIWAVHQAAQAWRSDQNALERLVMSPSADDLLRADR